MPAADNRLPSADARGGTAEKDTLRFQQQRARETTAAGNACHCSTSATCTCTYRFDVRVIYIYGCLNDVVDYDVWHVVINVIMTLRDIRDVTTS